MQQCLTTGSVFSDHLSSKSSDLESVFVTVIIINMKESDPRAVFIQECFEKAVQCFGA